MCVVSMVGEHCEHYEDKFRDYPWLQPFINPNPYTPNVPNTPYTPGTNPFAPKPTNSDWLKDYLTHQRPAPTREEYEDLSKKFDALKKEVEDMKVLLQRAIDYDKKNNEPNCEVEEKIAMLKQVAKLVGVDLEVVFRPQE